MIGWLILFGMVGAAAILWWWLFRMALPRVKGQLKGPGLTAPVTITRDQWGVPHIVAGSVTDAAYGLGFAHGQDRLWQMELQRRISAGRLAEAFGPVALEADRLLRRVGIRRAAEAEFGAMDPEELALLEAYCGGVNAAAAQGRLPLEFRLLGVKPAPWTPTDALSWSKMMAFSLVHNWEDELLRYQMAQQLGPETAARVEATYPPGQPLTNDPGGKGAADSAADLLRLFEAAKPFLLVPAGASNNWVVAGSRTVTGKPLLANDPHLVLQVPSVWYEAHVSCPEMEVTGATLPGVPGTVIGHNGKVAWGMTDAFADTADLFIEKWHPSEQCYEYQGTWEATTVLQEEIRVKGRLAVVEFVYMTRHGPLVAGGPLGQGPALSLRWSLQDPGHPVRAIARLNRAVDIREAREALRDWPAPCLNIVLADDQGEIGYVLAGRIPVRRNGTGLTPVPGWTGEFEWEGWVPYEEHPQLWNPECGYIVTANNRVVDEDYRHHISWDYMPGHRAQRLQDLLQANSALTVSDCIAMQMDLYSIPGVQFAALCRTLEPTDPLQQQAVAALLQWDGFLREESVGGAVCVVMQHYAARRAFGPLLGAELLDAWMGKGNILSPATGRVGRSLTVLLRELERGTLPANLLTDSLADAVAYLRRSLGSNPARWQWGRLHRFRPSHPLGAVRPLNLIFNGPEIALGGDMSTPAQTAYVPHLSYRAAAWAPSYRQIIDFADLNRSISIHPIGQSGQPGSRHYMDLLPLWHQGKYHPMPFGPETVQEHARATLTLQP